MHIQYAHRSDAVAHYITAVVTLENHARFIQHRTVIRVHAEDMPRPWQYLRQIYKQLRYALTLSPLIKLESPCRS